MDGQHENSHVLVPLVLMRKLIVLAEAQSDALMTSFTHQPDATAALTAAEDACRVVMDAGFPLDG